ncbi:hypothetical protein C1J03_07835 [Sulfitobacter sp. SK012]|uniref:TadE/TadG family type IV pilus assembly protein n=1 Tax=Sulfitobacter sp. SK012 TaxID=1389005 RepID=UPI000E0B9EC7|nr:pilus assembly protein [Sulfitobacter sp. SK012]AXI45939.1 hypothetical protein C1J03_07835 [Sulfitobacter sp. SK012]
MMRALTRRLRRFRKNEDGSVTTIEFVIMVPLIFIAFMMSIEMGVYTMRQMFLDRGLDITVRHVRLNTNTTMTHDQLKDMICTNSGFLPDCNDSLRLEMKPLDPRAFAAFDQTADCVDSTQPVEPVRGFSLGQEHELMVLRACVKFKPVFPATGLGYALEKDGAGLAKMISVSAFVQEPG